MFQNFLKSDFIFIKKKCFFDKLQKKISFKIIFQFILDHINYVRDLIGADHVGIGGDYDGVDQTPKGLEDVSKYPDLFDKLAEGGRGYVPWSKEELKKLAGLNLIRVFKNVESVRDSLKNEKIIDDPIPYNDIKLENPNVGDCRTDIEKYRPTEGKLLSALLKAEEEL